MSTPISCIIPASNSASNLPRAVASVLAQGAAMEIIIVDDCSDDTSFQVAQKLAAENSGKVRALRNTQRSGIGFTLNHAVFHARGSLLCFLEPDGEYLPGFVEGCAALLGDHPEFAAVQTLMEVVNPDGSKPFAADDPRLLAALDTYTSSMMVRKEVLLTLGGFPTDDCLSAAWGRAEDAFFNALTGLFRCMRVPQVMVRHHNPSDAHLDQFLKRSAAVIMEGGTQAVLRAQADVTAAAQRYYGRARRVLSELDRCRIPNAQDAAQIPDEGPLVSFVITCKGRLHHLQQTLPQLAALENTEIIVVDYGCPQGTADWVSKHYPQVRVGRVNDDPGFSLARARNIGAYAASSSWLCFVDADVVIDKQLLDWARDTLQPGAFYGPQPRMPNAMGSCFCSKSAFLEVGGYDEAIRGWGGEDVDFYRRLTQAGYREEGYPAALVSAIRHEDEERTQFYEIKDKARSMQIIEWYLLVKYDLMAIRNGVLPVEERMALMNLAKEAVLRADDGPEKLSQLSVHLGERMDLTRNVDWQVHRELVYSRSRR
jgi:glycosyltransferase involved in cell wall biosynthesis